MITRRRVLGAAALQGLAAYFGAAMAQEPKRKLQRNKKKSPPADRGPIQPDDRVSDVLAPIRDEHHLPGLIGAIFARDRLAAIGAVGVRKIGSSERIRVTDQIHIGSCTKAMTATLIGTLVDERKLSWGSTIAEVFPDQAEQIDADYQKVTVSQLLTHRAGLPANISWFHLTGRTLTEKRLSILGTTLRTPPRHRPGTTYEYSNVGYVLAGLIAETVAGRSWESLMKERLFDPLEMASAGFGSPGRPGADDQPWGHHAVRGEVRPTQQDNVPAFGPAGTVHCTMSDWSRFAALHLAAARGKPRLLHAATFRAPPHTADRLRLRRRLDRLPAHLGGRPGLHPQRQQYFVVRNDLARPRAERRFPGRD